MIPRKQFPGQGTESVVRILDKHCKELDFCPSSTPWRLSAVQLWPADMLVELSQQFLVKQKEKVFDQATHLSDCKHYFLQLWIL